MPYNISSKASEVSFISQCNAWKFCSCLVVHPSKGEERRAGLGFRGLASRRAGWDEGREGARQRGTSGGVSGSQRGAASKYQLLRSLFGAAAVWLSRLQTVVRRTRTRMQKAFLRREVMPCRIKWGFVSFGDVCSVAGSPRRWGSELSITLVFISLGSRWTSLSSA